MGFTILNEDDTIYVRQSVGMAADIQALVLGFEGTKVISGCAVTASGPADGNVNIAAGTVAFANVRVAVAGQVKTPGAAHATLYRIDLVVVDNTGTASIVAGVAAAEADAVMPAIPANRVILAAIHIPASNAAIDAAELVDKRVINPLNPDGTAALPSISFDLDPDTGFYRSGANTLALALAGGNAGGFFDSAGTKQWGAPDGSAAKPGYTFWNDTNLGLYRVGADLLGVSIGGVLAYQFGSTFLNSAGNAGNPAYSFLGDSNTGMFSAGMDTLGFTCNGTTRYTMDGSGFYPFADNSYVLGGSLSRWTALWAVDDTINTSDEKEKKQIKDSDRGLDFILKIQPKVFIWENGSRPHYGISAQQLKQVIDEEGKDFGGFVDPSVEANKRINPYSDSVPENENEEEWKKSRVEFDKVTEAMKLAPLGIRKGEFIAPLIQAIHDQQKIINDLRDRVTALEAV